MVTKSARTTSGRFVPPGVEIRWEVNTLRLSERTDMSHDDANTTYALHGYEPPDEILKTVKSQSLGRSAPRLGHTMQRLLFRIACAFVSLGFTVTCSAQGSTATAADFDCGPLENHFGPFDYRTVSDNDRRLVEANHLDLEQRLIAKGQTRGQLITSFGYVGGGLDYTLRAMPNHHVALSLVDRYGQMTKTEFPPALPRPVECYFERAVRFQPKDAVVRTLYANYLIKRDRKADAGAQLDVALSLDPQGASALYNVGLVLHLLGRSEEALEYAHRAYALGYPLPGLREMLKRAGKWREAPAVLSNK